MAQVGLVTIARWLVAALFLFSGITKIVDFDGTKSMMVHYRFPLPPLTLLAAIVLEIGGGILLGLGFSLQAVTFVLALYVIAASLMILVKQLWEPTLRRNALNHLAKNVAVVGALLHLYAYDLLFP